MFRFLRFFFVAMSLIILQLVVKADDYECQKADVHEFTVFVMPTLHPLNWESPSSLYRTMRRCYFRTIGVKDNYLLGHLAVGFNTPLLPEPLLIAQSSGELKEKLDLVFKEKVGFAIIGAALQGRIETHKELTHKLNVYAKRDKLAFIRYRVSEEAAQRMIDFITQYSAKMNEHYSPSDFYGGAFWPRYLQEGAGCSAFGMALLDLVNLLPEENTEDWEITVKIPMEVIGGKFNEGRRIRNSLIRKTNSWFEGEGEQNVDYVSYSVYDPSVMFDWIMDKRNNDSEYYHQIEENGVPGLLFDGTDVKFDKDEPLFIKRENPNLFIDHLRKKIEAVTDTIR